MADTLEIARFQALPGHDLAQAAAGIDPWLAGQPGFRSRTLVGPDGDGFYTDLVRWRSRADAEAAMAASQQEPAVGAFFAAIDPSSVQMRHAAVVHER